MSDDRWRPLRARTGQAREEWDVLVEGVPEWMAPGLIDILARFIEGRTIEVSSMPPRIRHRDMFLVREIERHLRVRSHIDSTEKSVDTFLSGLADQGGEGLLDLVDFLLSKGQRHPALFREMFIQSGSAWIPVSEPTPSLQRRVPDEVRQVAEDAMQVGGGAGDHLARAWERAFGRDPDPDAAYAEAIKAAEAALKPITIPNDSGATLGKMVGHLNAHTSDYRTRLIPSPSNENEENKGRADPVAAFIGWTKTLWQSHHRHADGKQAAQHAAEEARDAVVLAAFIVHAVQSGAFAPAGDTGGAAE